MNIQHIIVGIESKISLLIEYEEFSVRLQARCSVGGCIQESWLSLCHRRWIAKEQIVKNDLHLYNISGFLTSFCRIHSHVGYYHTQIMPLCSII